MYSEKQCIASEAAVAAGFVPCLPPTDVMLVWHCGNAAEGEVCKLPPCNHSDTANSLCSLLFDCSSSLMISAHWPYGQSMLSISIILS